MSTAFRSTQQVDPIFYIKWYQIDGQVSFIYSYSVQGNEEDSQVREIRPFSTKQKNGDYTRTGFQHLTWRLCTLILEDHLSIYQKITFQCYLQLYDKITLVVAVLCDFILSMDRESNLSCLFQRNKQTVALTELQWAVSILFSRYANIIVTYPASKPFPSIRATCAKLTSKRTRLSYYKPTSTAKQLLLDHFSPSNTQSLDSQVPISGSKDIGMADGNDLYNAVKTQECRMGMTQIRQAVSKDIGMASSIWIVYWDSGARTSDRVKVGSVRMQAQVRFIRDIPQNHHILFTRRESPIEMNELR